MPVSSQQIFHSIFHRLKNFSTSTATNPTITNQTGCLFRDYTSYYSMKLRLNFYLLWRWHNFLLYGVVSFFSFPVTSEEWVAQIFQCWVVCKLQMNQSWKGSRNHFLMGGCQVTIQSLPCWFLLCVSTKNCTIDRNLGT